MLRKVEPISPANKGLPPLKPSANCVSYFEFWHPVPFYAPIVLYALFLMLKHRSIMLPMLANPNIFAGGAIGERKSDVLRQAGTYAKSFIAPFVVVKKTQTQDTVASARKALDTDHLAYPLVAKPETGLRGSGVRPICNDDELRRYVEEFPIDQDIMLQKKVEHPAEAGVFYIRHPHQDAGQIFSLTLKYAATLRGDGVSTIAQLIDACPRCYKMRDTYRARHHTILDTVLPDGEDMVLNFAGNHAKGAIFRDGARHITPAMTLAFDRVAKDFPDLHFARFDVRFESLDLLKDGGRFEIVEVNGVGAEATHIWDCEMRLRGAYKVLARQWRHAFEIGEANRNRHHTLPSLRTMLRVWVSELKRADDYPLAS